MTLKIFQSECSLDCPYCALTIYSGIETSVSIHCRFLTQALRDDLPSLVTGQDELLRAYLSCSPFSISVSLSPPIPSSLLRAFQKSLCKNHKFPWGKHQNILDTYQPPNSSTTWGHTANILGGYFLLGFLRVSIFKQLRPHNILKFITSFFHLTLYGKYFSPTLKTPNNYNFKAVQCSIILIYFIQLIPYCWLIKLCLVFSTMDNTGINILVNKAILHIWLSVSGLIPRTEVSGSTICMVFHLCPQRTSQKQ